MEVLYLIFFVILGLILGSFYNVVGYRLPNNMSIAFPASHCPNCNHKLGPLELIPVFSYLFQLGKCKNCKQKISIQYPIIELLTGIMFGISYWIFGMSVNLFIALILVSIVVIIFVSDIKYMIIPDQVIIAGIILIFICKCFEGIGTAFMSLLYGLVTFAVMFLIKIIGDFVFKKESLGGGDIKFMFISGMCLGPIIGLSNIFLGSLIAFPIALLSVFLKKEHMIPYGPFLGIALLILFFFQVTPTMLYNIMLAMSIK